MVIRFWYLILIIIIIIIIIIISISIIIFIILYNDFFLGLSLVLKNLTILLLSVYWDPGQGEYLLLITGFFYCPTRSRSGQAARYHFEPFCRITGVPDVVLFSFFL